MRRASLGRTARRTRLMPQGSGLRLRAYPDASTRRRNVVLDEVAPGVLLVVASSPEGVEAFIQPPDVNTQGQSVPHVAFSVSRLGWLGYDEDFEECVTSWLEDLADKLGPLARNIGESARAGEFLRAAHVQREVDLALTIVRDIDRVDPNRKRALRRCRTVAQLRRGCSDLVPPGTDPALATFALSLVSLVLGHGIDIAATRPRELYLGVDWLLTPTIDDLKKLLPQYRHDKRTGSLIRESEEKRTIVLPRNTVQVIGRIPAGDGASPLATTTLSARLCQVPGESLERRMQRLRELALAVERMGLPSPRMPIDVSLCERWRLLVARAHAGQWELTDSPCLIPMPTRHGELAWLIRVCDGSLRVARFSSSCFGLVGIDHWAGPSAPSRGGGLLNNDSALSTVFGLMERLGEDFSEGKRCDAVDASAWTEAIGALLSPEWRPLAEMLAVDWYSWLRDG